MTNDPESDELHAALLEAHASGDHERIARLYVSAADRAERDADVDAACFFLTQAWVFALQSGLPESTSIGERLARHGRL